MRMLAVLLNDLLDMRPLLIKQLGSNNEHLFTGNAAFIKVDVAWDVSKACHLESFF